MSEQPLEYRTSERGDQRRAALLQSLDHHLQHNRLDAINVADISRRAGVTRSAFYFYFENKAVAVAALIEEAYVGAFTAANALSLRADSPAERIEAAIHGLFDVWEKHSHLFTAMLDARAVSDVARDTWNSDRDSFIPMIVELIEGERASGRAQDGPDAAMLATLLLELVDRALARMTTTPDPQERAKMIEGVVAIWLRTIYGHHPTA